MRIVYATSLDHVRIEVLGEDWDVTVPASRIIQMFEVAKELANMELGGVAQDVGFALSGALDADEMLGIIQEMEPILKLAIAIRDGTSLK